MHIFGEVAADWILPMLQSNPFPITENGCSQWHHVWELNDAANWTTDGLSIYMSQGAPYPNTGTPTRSN